MVKNVIYQTIIHSFESMRKVCASWRHLLLQNDVIMALDGVTSFLHLKDVTNTYTHIWRSLTICESSSVQWRNVGRAEDFKCVFAVYCV